MFDALLMISVMMVSADERREKEKREEETLGIVKALEGTTLGNRKTGGRNVKQQRREGAERPFAKQMNKKPQGNST
jgi:hypothetical protein